MRTIQTNVYQYNELSDKAKEKARDWYRNASIGDNYFAESIIYDAKEIGALFGLAIENIYWSGFGCQGDGACVTGRYSYVKGGLQAVKDYAPNDEALHGIVSRFVELQRTRFYRISVTIKHYGHYSHERSMKIEDNNGRLSHNEDEKELLDCLAYFSKWIYRQIEAEYYYQTSDEAVAETIEANDYEFFEEGKII